MSVHDESTFSGFAGWRWTLERRAVIAALALGEIIAASLLVWANLDGRPQPVAGEFVLYLLPAESKLVGEPLERDLPPSRLELAVVDYLTRVAEPAGRYRRRLEARLPTGELAVLAERAESFSPEEAGAVIASLDLAPDERATLLADLANGGLRAPEPETSPP